MAGQRGRDVLLKVSDGESSETFTTIAGIRTNRFEVNATSVDGTAADSPQGWRELIEHAGLKTARVRGNGVFKDAASDARMRQLFLDGRHARWQLIVPGVGHFIGAFQIRGLTWSGEYDGEAQFSVDLESAGALQFESAA